MVTSAAQSSPPVTRPVDIATSEAAAAVLNWPRSRPLAAAVRSGPQARRLHLAEPTAVETTPDIHAAAAMPSGEAMLLLPYDFGGHLEPAAASKGAPDRPPAAIRLALDSAGSFPLPKAGERRAPTAPARPLREIMPRSGYTARVSRILRYIRAGDVYQVNLAHHLRGVIDAHPRELFAALLETASPLHAAYAEHPGGRVVCSASPELYLRFDGDSRRVTTQPMKGTRPMDGCPVELERAEKDRAELNMIVDLMRNDLGRVARTGSVRVDVPRAVAPHAGGQLQATATVSADLREGLELSDLLAAAFPPGSVTGAPKIRAMQIIDELEPMPRGFYCGAIGWLGPRDAEFSVAIRTATLEPTRDGRWQIDLPVGAGIVADSDPGAEWEETLLKAAAFQYAIATLNRAQRS